MAAKTNEDVHLETVEEASNKGAEPVKAGDTGVAGLPMEEHQTGLLAISRKCSDEPLCNKRKARTGRIL
ncbi:hypothetical protein NKT34_23080 [Paenibacillus polysaccharolyticus]|uniref:hypothetical protein n=1 Tax=Paenibacillus polysaccharolyticus TaxID=582692 RepID=UPI00209ED92B|nr:hypothetical protein [Paenibacillus polysaccharolyticus]MCP1136186.1 hypothetical protein [Paenibacillus polysaccharolyticus]